MTTRTLSVRTGGGPPDVKSRDRSRPPLVGLLPLIAGLALWQVLGDPSSPYYPPPSTWAAGVRPLWEDGQLWPAIGWTAATFALGLLIATVVGSLVGTLVGSSRLADKALGPTLEYFRVLPAVTVIPALVLVLGYGLSMKLLVVLLASVWPILLTCRLARRNLNPLLMDVSATLGLTRREEITKILIPAMVRPTLLGVRVAAPISMIATLLVELVTQINGLGGLLGYAQKSYLSAQVYGLLVISGALALSTNWLIGKLEHRLAQRLGPN